MRNLAVSVLALAIWLSQLTICDAASFNCRPYLERRACPEMLICAEATLSQLDDRMAELYEDARSRMPEGHLPGFRDYQREWLVSRNRCGCNYQCLARQYREQIDGLRRTIDQMGR